MNNITLFILIFIVLILIIVLILFFRGNIPKTRTYYLNQIRLFLLKTDCHNHNNITYLLKHFGYLKDTIDNNNLLKIDEKTKIRIEKITAKYKKDYSFKNDPQLKKQVEQINNDSKLRCKALGEYYIRHIRIFYHTTECKNINNPTYLLQHFGYIEKVYDDYFYLEKESQDKKKIDIIYNKFLSRFKFVKDDPDFSKQLNEIIDHYELQCLIES